MIAGQGLTFLAVALQSAGKVLYGTWLAGISTATFLLASFCVTAAVCLCAARFRLPRGGLRHIVLVNVWTALAFVAFFFALKHLAPASVGAIEIGAAVLVAVIAESVSARAWPRRSRVVVSAGIVAGCAVLALAEFRGAGGAPAASAWPLVGLALGASVLSGVASARMAASFKALAACGWSSASILAHRFYLTIVVALVWLLSSGGDLVPSAQALPAVLAVSAIGVLLPLLLLQFALRRADTSTVLICAAIQPVVSFAFALLSPAYDWSGATLAGVLIVTAALMLDVRAQRRAAPAARPAGGATHGALEAHAWRTGRLPSLANRKVDM
jgi:drug/metabolite transporter (DMT)-like permease